MNEAAEEETGTSLLLSACLRRASRASSSRIGVPDYHLRFGLPAVLVFIGAKMLLGQWHKTPIGVALSVVGGIADPIAHRVAFTVAETL